MLHVCFMCAEFGSALATVLSEISSDVEEFLQLLKQNNDGWLSHTHTHTHTITHAHTYTHVHTQTCELCLNVLQSLCV